MMALHKLVLSQETTDLPIGELVQQAANGGLEIQDDQGTTLAFVLCPGDEEAWSWAEAIMHFAAHREEIIAAGRRRTGITTPELLQNMERAGKVHDLENALATVAELVHEKVGELKSQGSHFCSGDEQTVPKAKAG